MDNNNKPSFSTETIRQSKLITQNYSHHTGSVLFDEEAEEALAHKLYFAPFVVLSHDTNKDPVFNYVNLKAQELWEMPWEEMIGMPSRQSAEPDAEKERQRLLEEAERNGFVKDYRGIRISKNGHRFEIRNVLLMNLYDENNRYAGQSAVFNEWYFL